MEPSRWHVYIVGIVLFLLYMLWNLWMYRYVNNKASPFYSNIFKFKLIKGGDFGICLAASFVFPICAFIVFLVFKYLFNIQICLPGRKSIAVELLSIQIIIFIILFVYTRVLLGKPVFDKEGWKALFRKIIHDGKAGLAEYNRKSINRH